MRQTRITVLGSLNMDLVVRTRRFPVSGETVLGEAFATIPGGKGANQAVAAARLGAHVCMIGCVGSDAFGRTLRDGLAAEGIDVDGVRPVPGATGIASIVVDGAGANQIVVVPGANDRLVTVGEDDLRRIRGSDYLVMQLEVPLATVEEAALDAAEAGVPVILNPAPVQPLSPGLLGRVAWLVVNETELAALGGTAEGTAAEIAASCERLVHRPPHVVVTLGGRGALYIHESQYFHAPAPEVPVVDTTAAGDTFVGALAVALGDGKTPVEAVRFAVQAAAISVTRFGAQPSMPRRAEVVF